MRPINLTNVVEQSDGDFPRLEPGAYACLITEVEDFPKQEYIRLLVDISMGDRANYFASDFYKDKPFTHSIIMSYKPKALGMLKGRLHTITDCNPGFDAEAAINAGKEQMLAGLAVGVVFQEEEYFDKKTEEFKIGSARPARLITFDKLEDERNAHPKPRMLKDDRKRQILEENGIDPDEWKARQSGQKVPSVEVYSEDLPF